ncbi:MAG: insulinase family protein [Alphaproteobacteria bacterium]|nr:insulinase family protein [Alphaproteobacteria bacterium]
MFRHERLGNGLEIVAECNAEAHTTALGFFVKTGSRDESDDVAGVSHFLEHMMFKGTAKRSAEDVNREFDEMGAHYNAFTSEENTVYYASLLPEYQGRAVELLADIMRPALRTEDFDTEKQVIIEEIRMYDDQPPFGADEKCKAAYFGAHPLGRSVLGTVDSVGGLPVDKMRAYFQRRYSPDNIVLAAAGRVDFEALVQSARDCCGNWAASSASRTVDEARPHAGFSCLQKASATQEYTVQLAAGPSVTDPDRFAAKVLATVIGDDSGSRLYWELIDPGLVEHVSLTHYDYQGTGLFMTYMSCAAELTQENLQRVLNLYRRVESGGVEKVELEQAKRKINSRVVLSSERPRGRLFTLGTNWTQRGEYRTVNDDLAAVAAVTREDIATLLKKYPLTTSRTIVVGPLEVVAAPV